MKKKITYLLFSILILIGFSFSAQITERTEPIKLLTTDTEFAAGEQIQLKFSSELNAPTNLYISNSYGSTLLLPEFENELLLYTIPENISSKSGIVNWKILDPDQTLSGSVYIKPKALVKSLESYLGPPSIQAGEADFSMMVVIPTDELDNPLQDNTMVTIKTQFLDREVNSDVITKNLLAYKNIYSPKESGRILVGSESLGTTSKEFDINVLASIPTDFTISEQRNHKYADGNQIVTLSTSQIKDAFENVVEDGTLIEFYIKTNNGAVLKATGTTIDGVAKAKIIYPDHADEWTVKAIIKGMGESDEIVFYFEQLFDDFEVSFSEDNRTVGVGPLKSFMQQLIPDGFNVNLSVYRDQELIQTINKQTVSGQVTFKLNYDVLPDGNYMFKINTAGLEKTFNSKKLW
jgi:hypothetical protein